MEAGLKGPLIGARVQNVRVVLEDGAAHSVDSSELAFRIAAGYAFKQGFENCSPQILEPIMLVDINVPSEFQGAVVGGLTRRKGMIQSSHDDDGITFLKCEVPLSQMFGYSTDLRTATQGKGEFSMEYCRHSPVTKAEQAQLIDDFRKKRAAKK